MKPTKKSVKMAKRKKKRIERQLAKAGANNIARQIDEMILNDINDHFAAKLVSKGE